jgi:hypothetical protein
MTHECHKRLNTDYKQNKIDTGEFYSLCPANFKTTTRPLPSYPPPAHPLAGKEVKRWSEEIKWPVIEE